LFPTLIEIANGNTSRFKNLNGISLLATIRKNSTLKRKQLLFGYRAYEDLYASVRQGDWKLRAYRSGKVKLYNIKNDIGEKNDVSQQQSIKAKALTKKLTLWEKEMGVERYSGFANASNHQQ